MSVYPYFRDPADLEQNVGFLIAYLVNKVHDDATDRLIKQVSELNDSISQFFECRFAWSEMLVTLF